MSKAKIKSIIKEYLPLIAIILLSSLLRLVFLGRIPTGIGADELNYVLTAKSISLSFSNIQGTWNPLSLFLFHYPMPQAQAELPYFLLLPVLSVFKFSLFSTRITNALLSVGIVILVYFISKELFNKQSAIYSSIVAAINPWLIYIGRTAYEMTPAIFFFLLSLYILLVAKKWKILYSILSLAAAFYSYIATKIIFLPFVLIMLLYCFFVVNNKKYLKQYLIVFLLSLSLVAFFTVSSKNTSLRQRASQILTPDSTTISSQVNTLRKNSIKNPLTYALENKATVFATSVTDNFFNAISSDYLFLYGDSFFSIWTHGVFYYLDFIFIILGIAFIFSKNARTLWFLLTLCGLSIFPQAISTNTSNFTPHITLLFPFVILIMGFGIADFLRRIKNKKMHNSLLFLIAFFYMLLLINFINIYFYQLPLKNYSDFATRPLSRYIELSKNIKQQIFIYSSSSADLFDKYIFYDNRLNKNTKDELRKDFNNNLTKIGNITFASCQKSRHIKDKKDLVIYSANCGEDFGLKNVEHLSIDSLIDGGQEYRIYNDSLCSKFSLRPYPIDITLSSFNVEKLSLSAFCISYIFNP